MSARVVRLFAGTALAAGCALAHSALVYSIANDGTTLVRFDSANPAAVTTIGAFSGATTRLSGMDFRPADGQLYGFNQATSGIYRIDVASGSTTLVSTSSVAVSSPRMGIDFNPVPDRLRVVAPSDQNLRVNIANGVVANGGDGTLKYVDGNAGVNPNIVDAAYTNHDRDPATGTTLYYIDSLLDVLTTTNAPNEGNMTVVGALGVDTDEFTGFDIFTDSGVNTAFVSLTSNGQSSLYTINLSTGAATLLGAIGAQQLYGLAVAPIPEPAPLALLAVAAVALRLRRRAT